LDRGEDGVAGIQDRLHFTLRGRLADDERQWKYWGHFLP